MHSYDKLNRKGSVRELISRVHLISTVLITSMATNKTVRASSFDVCGLDDPKIEIRQNVIKADGNISKLRKYVSSDSGLKESYHKFGSRNGWSSRRLKSEADATVVNLLQVNF